MARPPSDPRRRHDTHVPAADDADRVAAALRSGRARANAAFDALLPDALRTVSEDYWTPTPVVRQVAAWLRAEGCDSVVDIGSGPGKFCIALALLTPCRVVGLEHRRALVAIARSLAVTCGVADRASFVHGRFGPTPVPAADAYYLFNPFGDYTFDAPEFLDDGIVFTRQEHRRDVEALTRFLGGLPAGARVITYNGIGRPLPRSFEQVRVDVSFRGALRLWKKRAPVRRSRA